MNTTALVAELTNPSSLLIHIPYALLVISMAMNDMGWLRTLAIAAGLVRIANRAFIDVDPVIALWEAAFVGVNVVQLTILWYYAKRHRFTADEQRFVDILPAGVDRRVVRRLLRLGRLETAEPGTSLTVEGQPVKRLAFLTDGVAQVERASATVVCARSTSYFAFDQDELRRALQRDSDMRRIVDAGFSRNLAVKLARSGTPPALGG